MEVSAFFDSGNYNQTYTVLKWSGSLGQKTDLWSALGFYFPKIKSGFAALRSDCELLLARGPKVTKSPLSVTHWASAINGEILIETVT